MDAMDKLKNVVTYLQNIKKLRGENEEEKEFWDNKWNDELNNMMKKIDEKEVIPKLLKL
jgi:hypothetical protein